MKAHTGFLTSSELKESSILCYKLAQKREFSIEILALKEKKPIRKDSKLIKLTPFLDSNGLLRVGGRLEYSGFAYDTKHPIILPYNHHVTKLVIMEEHRRLHHPSAERLLCSIQQTFRIIRSRAAINRCLNGCFICKRMRAKPDPPMMAALPRHRLEALQPPFTNTGIDYFGPIEVKYLRRSLKRYALLCTCLVTRAVHIEISYSLDTDSFIMAFQRFCDRRGRPAVVYSDNGTQLVAGEKELREGLNNFNQEKIAGAMANKSIEWHFSPPAAPHFGGVWESLVKSAKIALKSIVNSRTLDDEMLITIMIEVESLLNSRPLTHISVDPRDPEPLTPNHFLLGRASPNIPPDSISSNEITSRRRWRAAQVLVDHFWRRWMKEYLPSVIERRKWLSPAAANLKKDDVVLICDQRNSRGSWPIGWIVRPIPSPDGIVRSAIVKTAGGEFERPTVKLCLLESDVFDPLSKTGPAVTDVIG